ncbi:MAG TPA: hypothetical protein VG013_36975 [Gemmataceae bacterium]|nr:hypothetical protein [Gemmataceae bacterium]
MRQITRRQVFKAVAAGTLSAGGVLLAGTAKASDATYKCEIKNEVADDLVVGIFGVCANATFRHKIPSDETYTARDDEALVEGHALVVAWDCLEHHKVVVSGQVEITEDSRITIGANNVKIAPL